MIIENTLFFDDNLNNKVSRGVGITTKLKNLLPVRILQNIYFALIHSYFNYGLLVWGATFNSYLSPLLAQQNKALITLA